MYGSSRGISLQSAKNLLFEFCHAVSSSVLLTTAEMSNISVGRVTPETTASKLLLLQRGLRHSPFLVTRRSSSLGGEHNWVSKLASSLAMSVLRITDSTAAQQLLRHPCPVDCFAFPAARPRRESWLSSLSPSTFAFKLQPLEGKHTENRLDWLTWPTAFAAPNVSGAPLSIAGRA